MSSDLFFLNGSLFRHSNSDTVSSDLDLQFLSDPFFSFTETPSDIIQSISDNTNHEFPADPSPFSDQNSFNLISCSPPRQKTSNLSIGSKTQLQSLPIAVNSEYNFPDFSVLETSGVKSEDCYVGFDYPQSSSLLTNNSYDTEKAIRMMQRSFSSHSLDRKSGFLYQPRFNSLPEYPYPETQVMGSPKNSQLTRTMRRVCSAGDLQRIKRTNSSHGLGSSLLAAENPLMEETSFRVRPYTAEERKKRINRYRNKRTQRNFNKKIKYACRKTLADSRPRVRGRFARNDETGEIPKATGFNPEEEDEDELWVDGFPEEDEEMRRGGGGVYINSFSPIPTQFEYLGF